MKNQRLLRQKNLNMQMRKTIHWNLRHRNLRTSRLCEGEARSNPEFHLDCFGVPPQEYFRKYSRALLIFLVARKDARMHRFYGMQNTLLILGGLALLFTLSPTTTLALTETPIQGDLIAEITPKNPGSYTTVTVKVVSYGEDVNQSIIAWTVNGNTVAQGVGMKSFSTQTGAVGQRTTINVQVIAPTGVELEKEITIIPAEVDLLWHTSGYLPPWYKGKAPVTANTSVVFTAMPTVITGAGKRIGGSQLYYEWSRNYAVDAEASGYGKEQATFSNFSGLKEDIVRVHVRDTTGDLVAENSVALKAYAPTMLVYEESPLQGTLFQRAFFDTYILTQNENTLRAEPYYLEATKSGSAIRYEWTLDGTNLRSGSDADGLITLRHEKAEGGVARLACTATNGSSEVTGKIALTFGRGATIGF